MDITITINGRSFTRDLKDLTKGQAYQLGVFLGLHDCREGVFAIPELQEMNRFKPVRVAEVLAQCPKRNKFTVKFGADDIGAEDAPAPGFRALRRKHYGEGYCRVCKTKHGVYRSGLLVATEVEGLPFSREYEVKK